jgi:hypothetical protein
MGVTQLGNLRKVDMEVRCKEAMEVTLLPLAEATAVTLLP